DGHVTSPSPAYRALPCESRDDHVTPALRACAGGAPLAETGQDVPSRCGRDGGVVETRDRRQAKAPEERGAEIRRPGGRALVRDVCACTDDDDGHLTLPRRPVIAEQT